MAEDAPQKPEHDEVTAKTEVDESLKKVAQNYKALFDETQGARPRTLYHHTNGPGLRGILESNRFWATHAQYLNDSTELIYAYDLIKAAVDQQIEEQAPAAVIELGRHITGFVDPLHIRDFLKTYMVCFCEEGDLLSQWRGYGGGMGGYSLGLHARDIGERSGEKAPEQDLQLYRVIYSRSVQEALIGSIISGTFDVLRSTGEKYGNDAARIAMFECTPFIQRRLTICLICFKSPAFSEEKEWRVVHVEPSYGDPASAEVKFRMTATNIIPYVELDLSPFAGVWHNRIPLSKVVYGPSPHPDLLRASLRMMLEHYGYSRGLTDVEGSTIPLRA